MDWTVYIVLFLWGLSLWILKKYYNDILKVTQQMYERRIQRMNEEFEQRLEEVKESVRQSLETEYRAKLEQWRLQEEKRIREDAIKRSSVVIRGKVAEQFVPILKFQELGFNPKDARFIGNPIDYIVFDGLYDGNLRRIVFVEVKTGKANLNKRERMICNVVKDGKVDFIEVRLDGEG